LALELGTYRTKNDAANERGAIHKKGDSIKFRMIHKGRSLPKRKAGGKYAPALRAVKGTELH
jgi:hypothetical protein